MSVSAKLRRAPLRAATGAYILNSGVTKMSADDDTAKTLHGMASGTYPFLGKLEPKTFAKALAVGEMAVGTTLLLPIVPPVLAGAALVGFSGALLNMYWHTPGMHHEGSLRPTSQGSPISKDVWMFGIGLGLITDATLEGAREGVADIEASISKRRTELSRKARRKARRARVSDAEYMKNLKQRAEDVSETAGKRLADARDEYGPIAADKMRTAGEAARNAYDEYRPVAVEKAQVARDAARQAYDDYRPVAVEKAQVARDAARQAYDDYRPVAVEKAQAARDAARHAYQESRNAIEEYGPVAAKKMKAAGQTAQEYAARARQRLSS
ncbi:MAG TPA: hypothetical protein VE442_13345 [Jatrophihabitans sp.]|jgi:uncharacterized membrane protein YphA (DoxX/SURF4 family)|nr:hypothetical protein [Jatrophihabitans sp.]